MYVGETSRTAFFRNREHFTNYRAAAAAKIPPNVCSENRVMCGKPRCVQQNKCKCDMELRMWEHTHEYHNGKVGENGGLRDYRLIVTKKCSKCLDREVHEDIRIRKCVSDGWTLLNSKNEYFTPKSVQAIFKQW